MMDDVLECLQSSLHGIEEAFSFFPEGWLTDHPEANSELVQAVACLCSFMQTLRHEESMS